MNSRQPLPILQIEIGTLAPVLIIKRDTVLILQDVDLDTLAAQQILVAAGARHVAYDDPGELAHIKKRGAHIAGAECGVERCPAEVLPPGILIAEVSP